MTTRRDAMSPDGELYEIWSERLVGPLVRIHIQPTIERDRFWVTMTPAGDPGGRGAIFDAEDIACALRVIVDSAADLHLRAIRGQTMCPDAVPCNQPVPVTI